MPIVCQCQKCRISNIIVIDCVLGDLEAVYSPHSDITACEIMSDGKYVVLAMQGKGDLLTLELRTLALESISVDDVYGSEDNCGKEFLLNENDAC